MRARFDGKTVLVTGGSRGQGAAEARQFAQEGANVIIADIRSEEGKELARSIGEAGGSATYLDLDVSSPEAWERAAEFAKAKFGGLDVLVNNAGIALRRGSLMAIELDDWERVIRVNLTGVFLGIRTMAPLIRDQGGGAIVNTGSIAGMTGHFATAYSASKWGLRGLAKSAAMELAEWNIRVNNVHPGIVKTPIVEGSEDFVEAMEWMTPLGRAGTSEELAEIVLFLASDDASFLTGVDIAADGGFTDLAAYRAVLRRVRSGAGQRL